jgi:hypothetical protein
MNNRTNNDIIINEWNDLLDDFTSTGREAFSGLKIGSQLMTGNYKQAYNNIKQELNPHARKMVNGVENVAKKAGDSVDKIKNINSKIEDTKNGVFNSVSRLKSVNFIDNGRIINEQGKIVKKVRFAMNGAVWIDDETEPDEETSRLLIQINNDFNKVKQLAEESKSLDKTFSVLNNITEVKLKDLLKTIPDSSSKRIIKKITNTLEEEAEEFFEEERLKNLKAIKETGILVKFSSNVINNDTAKTFKTEKLMAKHLKKDKKVFFKMFGNISSAIILTILEEWTYERKRQNDIPLATYIKLQEINIINEYKKQIKKEFSNIIKLMIY